MIKENVFVSPNDLSGRLGSKQDLYNILDIDRKGTFNRNDIVGIFLPPYEKCPTSFLRDIFAKKKLTIEHKQARLLPVPRYKELGVKAVWVFIKEVPELLKYFPNCDKDELPDRSFMWTILSTLRHDECKQLINEARNARSKNDKQNHDELIEIDSEFLDKLIATPILSTGKGRVAYLLKSARQAKFARKKPKEYQSNLAVLKSNKKDASISRKRSNMYEEEEKKESDTMNVDGMQRRDDNSAFAFSPPPKVFSQSKFPSKKTQEEDEERLEF